MHLSAARGVINWGIGIQAGRYNFLCDCMQSCRMKGIVIPADRYIIIIIMDISMAHDP